MKKIFFPIFAVWLCMAQAYAQLPFLQFVHNSPDPALSEVKILLEDQTIVENFRYREASGQQQYFASTYTITVQSASVSRSFSISLAENRRYAAVLSGVLDSSGFADNPSGVSRELSLDLVELPENPSTADAELYFYDGVMDVGTARIYVRNSSFWQETQYRKSNVSMTLPIGLTYYFSVVAGADTVGLFEANLESPDVWAKTSPLVLISGFRCPEYNSGGEKISMQAVLAQGSVIPFFPVRQYRCDITSSVADNAKEKFFPSVFPNPAKEKISFELEENFFSPVLQISDAPGNKILEKKFSSGEKIVLDVSSFPAGIFFYTISDGEKILRGKFVKLP